MNKRAYSHSKEGGMTLLEFELAYCDVAIQHISHNATRTPSRGVVRSEEIYLGFTFPNHQFYLDDPER